MTTWKVARATKTCALSGRPLPADAPIVAALFGVAEEVSDDKVRGTGLARRDFLVDGNDPAALASATAGAFCVWHTKTAPEHPSKAHRLDLGLARELLERLRAEGDPAKASVLWTLALLLVRKRQLHLVQEHPAPAPADGTAPVGSPGGELEVRWPKEDATFRVPSVVVTEAEQESLQQEIARLFEF
jgi:hypothetical protein